MGDTHGVSILGAPILAHEGGWDEILLVVTPLAIIGLLLHLANKRVNAQLADDVGVEPVVDGTEESPPPDDSDDGRPTPTAAAESDDPKL